MIAAGWTAISHMSAHIFGLRRRGQKEGGLQPALTSSSALAQAKAMSFSFINLSPESILRDAPQGLRKESPPSDREAHLKQWVPIIENLLHKKLPSEEQAWDAFVTSQNDVQEVLNLVSLQSIPERATMSWEQLFDACGKHFRVLQRTNRGKQCTPYFRLAVIALSVIAMEYEPRNYVFDWLRRCLEFCPGPKKGLGDESLRKLVKAIKNGIIFIDSFTDVLGQRAHELPFHG
jgi:hypothetical protein